MSGLIKDKFGKDSCEISILNLGTKVGVYEHSDGGYPESLKQEIKEFLKDKQPEMIGVTMLDYGVERISQLIKEIAEDKEINTKIIAGGPFAIEHAERCINIEGVDVACYTKGWHFADIVEANSKGNLKDIPGLMIKSKNEDGNIEIITTPPPDLKETIAFQPLPDESLEHTYMIYKDKLLNISQSGGALPVEHHQVAAKHTAVLVTSEGCPNTCSFCSIPTQWKTLESHVTYRVPQVASMSPENSIKLVENYLKHNPNTEYILFNDNDFAARPKAYIKEIMQLYKERIALPFYVQCSPNTATKDKIDLLAEGGMDTFTAGVQGSEKANRDAEYERGCTDAQVLNVVKSIAPYIEQRNEKGVIVKDGVKLSFDFINGNATHSKEDMASTLSFIKEITKSMEESTKTQEFTKGSGSWNLAIHNLTLDSDRELAKKYKEIQSKEGVSVGEVDDSDYHNASIDSFYKLKEPYLNILLEWLAGLHDSVHSGRLPKNTQDFLENTGKIVEKEPALKRLFIDLSKDYPETVDLLTSNEAYKFFSNTNNANARNILKQIYEILPKIHYSYQRSDRSEFDYGWAEDQIRNHVGKNVAAVLGAKENKNPLPSPN